LNNQKEITISPTTRIEGHGKVTILLDETGNVANAHLHATEIRGFDYFLKGMDAFRLPFIISRICGVCSTAHTLASVKAIEKIFGTKITETAEKLRKLLIMGQVINNHSLVYFFLTLPDFWFPLEENPSKRNVFQIIRENPEIGRKAIALRSFATKILDVVGKREIHVVSVIPGGLITPLKESERVTLLQEAEKMCTIARESVEMGKELFDKNWEEFKKAGNYMTHYMATSKDNLIDYCDGFVRIISSDGKIVSDIPQKDYLNYIKEARHEWTYAKFAYLKLNGNEQEIVQVGPMARINVSEKMDTEFSNGELKEFKKKYGNPAHSTILFDYARLIELLYACEKVKEILQDKSITNTNVRVKIEPKDGKAVGIVEAPRGTLAHEYTLAKNGRLMDIKLIIPTQINNIAINTNLKDAAKEFIKNGEIKPGLLNRIEMIIRAYDPCIKCATRTVSNHLKVEVRDCHGKIVKF